MDREPGPAAGEPGPGFVAAMGQALSAMLARPVSPRFLRGGLVARARGNRPVARRMHGIWVLAGLHGDGLVLAPALGEEIAEEILRSR